ncbi:hypothetical protein AHiyo1_42520 [Arthrobacter sp. Hiyo1]|nr:hypothetical protein AHiyo1_42520 [Arthrobacter sp. Hiyo1]
MQVQAIQRQSQLVQVTPEPAQQGGFADQAAAFAGEQVQCFKRSPPVGEPVVDDPGRPVEDRQDAAGFVREPLRDLPKRTLQTPVFPNLRACGLVAKSMVCRCRSSLNLSPYE